MFNGLIVWEEKNLGIAGQLVCAVLGIGEKDFETIETAEDLEAIVASRLNKMSKESLKEICFILTSKKGEKKDV